MARQTLLTPHELGLWTAWQTSCEAVVTRVCRDIAEKTGLSAADYAVLACLIENGNGQLRQRELAVALNWDKSRISHQLSRMEVRKLLTRSKTAETGSQVVITRLGRSTFERARPVHAQAVRRHLLERLTPEQRAAILSLSAASA